MCGIWGIIDPSGPTRWADAAARMHTALRHRGPDAASTWSDDHIVFGMTRLSIVDVAGGDQPFISADGRYLVVANGEIYNSAVLRAQLSGQGHMFRSGSDCETILHLYEDDGVRCVRRLRGMFAFAVYDRLACRLVLGRDRLGEKPLYVAVDTDRVLFASELKSMLSSGLVSLTLDPEAVQAYFHFQYVPEPATPVLEVRKVPPGCVLELDVRTLQSAVTEYWSMSDVPLVDGDPIPLLRSVLQEVESGVFAADVPVGVSLSGGLDSTLVAAMLARSSPERAHAFTVGYPGRPSYDERDCARETARLFGLEYHEVELSIADVADSFPAVVAASDDPIADISAPCYFALSAEAQRQGVSVLAQGQGGDELFWGYGWVRRAALAARSESGSSADSRLQFYEHHDGFAEAQRSLCSIVPSRLAAMLDPDAPLRSFVRCNDETIECAVTRLIMSTYLLENGIAQGDRLAMANGVELRLPLVDHRFVEAVLSLRSRQPDLDLAPKSVLRTVAEHWLPPGLARRPKRAFVPPIGPWSQTLFRRYGSSLLDGMLVGLGVLRPEAAVSFAVGGYDPARPPPLSYKALVLETWLREMAEAPGVRLGAPIAQ